MNIAYCMTMTLISSNVYLMLSLGILSAISILSIKGVCVAALAPTVMTISKSTFHPLLIILYVSGLIFSIFMIIVLYGILSLQYVNSMNYVVRLSLGSISGGD